MLSPGQAHDSPFLKVLLGHLKVNRAGQGRPRTRPDALLADKAYSSRSNRAMLSARGIKVVIPERDDQKANRRRRRSEQCIAFTSLGHKLHTLVASLQIVP